MPTLKPQRQTMQISLKLKETSSAQQLQPSRAFSTSQLCLRQSYQTFSVCPTSRGDQQSRSAHLPGADPHRTRALLQGAGSTTTSCSRAEGTCPAALCGLHILRQSSRSFSVLRAMCMSCLACGTQNEARAPSRGGEG